MKTNCVLIRSLMFSFSISFIYYFFY